MRAIKRIISIVLLLMLVFPVAQASGLELGAGSKGTLVAAIQAELIAQGNLSGAADGVFGTQTAQAVKSVQAVAGLPETGIIDTRTYYAIYASHYVDDYPDDRDDLQVLYYLLHFDMGVDEVLELLDLYGLPYMDKIYNGGRKIKVAFSEDVTPHTHAKPGDHIDIHFNELERQSGNYVLDYIEYYNDHKFFTMSHYVDRLFVTDYETYEPRESIRDIPEYAEIPAANIDEQFELMAAKQ